MTIRDAFRGKGICSFVTLVAALASTPVQAKCWSDQAAAAAEVRDFETMLMVSALRCRTTGVNFLPRYNHFVRTGRVALVQANDNLRTHFTATHGAGGLNAYDRYVTSIANRYGSGAEGLDCGDLASIVEAAIAESKSFAQLHQVAMRADMRPELRGGRCNAKIAARYQR